jgi:hypothetical protein
MCFSLAAQGLRTSNVKDADIYEAQKRVDHYHHLRNMGYQDKEIFEDLGNANFLAENYESALFWYEKLIELSDDGIIGPTYYERYQYAQGRTGRPSFSNVSEDKDWYAAIKADYEIKKNSVAYTSATPASEKYRELDFLQQMDASMDGEVTSTGTLESLIGDQLDDQNGYKAPISMTGDGKTAYFSMATYEKPMYGIFSKKELIHKIYRAEQLDGQWGNVQEVTLAPKHYSTMHPTVSADGKRLFFASDMPGTFGKYDIYVAAVQSNGAVGVAKNLGEKVNTEKNELYPNLAGGTTLFFASEGREGYGGLDVFMVQVNHKKVSWAVNLGNPINSEEDDFSIFLMAEKGEGYVMSNRGTDRNAINKVAFSYTKDQNTKATEKREYNLLEALNNDLRIDYSSSVFDND